MPGPKTGMDFTGQVWKQVWKMTFFCLEQGQDLENRAAHLHQEFPGVPTPPPPPSERKVWARVLRESCVGDHTASGRQFNKTFTSVSYMCSHGLKTMATLANYTCKSFINFTPGLKFFCFLDLPLPKTTKLSFFSVRFSKYGRSFN